MAEGEAAQANGVDGSHRDASAQDTPTPEPQTNGNGATKSQPTPKQMKGLKDKIKTIKKGPPGGFDATPLPDAPQGYTVRFTFRSASNVPPSDLATASSDPFITATLRASNPKRHKEDPDLEYRTRTIRKTTEPEWNDDWIVANVPSSGFNLKCRMYDEDAPNHNDRLGNFHVKVGSVREDWKGFPPPGKEYEGKKRVMSKKALFLKGIVSAISSQIHLAPRLLLSIEVLGKSDPPHAQMYTVGPCRCIKHYSPMIGRLAGTKVNRDEEHDHGDHQEPQDREPQKYDFQANEMQLAGPVPPKMYHRYVEFKPVIGSMFSSKGVREYWDFEPCSKDAALQLLRLAHFDEGGRVFTYVLTLDGLLRFTETGKEFGIDLLSKHTMHSNVATYIACSGEFFIRRLEHPDASEDPEPNERTHPDEPVPGGPPKQKPPLNSSYYQLVIDNDSGTYRPDKSVLPDLKAFLERNFPGLGIVAMHWEEEELKKLKETQRNIKKSEGRMMNVVMNRSQSSISSAESDLDDREGQWEDEQHYSNREKVLGVLVDPKRAKTAAKGVAGKPKQGSSSKQGAEA